MKISKILTFVASSVLIANSMSMPVKDGWQIYGVSDKVDIEKLSNQCIDYIWTYDNTNKDWKALVLDGKDYGYSGTSITSIDRQDALWVMGNSDCNVTINDLPEDEVIPEGTPKIVTADKLYVDENRKDIAFMIAKGSTGTLEYSIAGGSEHYLFEIDSVSGLLQFKDFPNYEKPLDVLKENKYEVKVQVKSGELSSIKTMNVIVNDVDDTVTVNGYPYDIVEQVSIEGSNQYKRIYTPTISDGSKIASVTGTIIAPDSTETAITYKSDGTIVLLGTQSGTYTVNLVVTDEDGNEYTKTFTYTTVSSSDYPQNQTLDVTVRSSELIRLDLNATDTNNNRKTYTIVDQPTNGTISVGYDGSYWYRSNFGYMGEDTLTFSSHNGYNSSYSSSNGVVNINVISANRAPEVPDRTVDTNEDRSVTIKLTSTDYEYDDVVYTIESQTRNGTLTKISNDTYEYMPSSDYFGKDSFTYSANDGTSDSNIGTVSIEVYNINDAPTIDAEGHTIEPKFISRSFVIDQNTLYIRQTTKTRDLDGDDLTFNTKTPPAHGSLMMAKDGGYVYVPDYGYSGADSFTYSATDGKSSAVEVTVYVVVQPIPNTNPKPLIKTDVKLSVDKNGAEITNPDYLDDAKTQRGVAKSYTRQSNGIVVDNVTGLMWQDDGANLAIKQSTKDIFTGEDTYRIEENRISVEEGDAYCANLTLGGYDDWRVPAEAEMRTLTDYSIEGSAALDFSIGMDVIYKRGKNMISDEFQFVASNRSKNMIFVYGWYLTSTYEQDKHEANYKQRRRYNFTGSYGRSLPADTKQGVMCVRGDWVKESVYLKDDKKKIIYDLNTNLMWQDDEDLQYHYIYDNGTGTLSEASTYVQPLVTRDLDESIEYCNKLTLGGFTDWKVPNMNELQTLVSDYASTSDLVMDNTQNDKEYAAINFLIADYVSSTSKVKSIKEHEYHDTLGYEIEWYFPWITHHDYEAEDKFDNLAEGSDFFYGGVNFKACNKAEYKGVSGVDPVMYYQKVMSEKAISKDSIYDNSECRAAMAKYNYVAGISAFGLDNSTTYSIDLPHGNLLTNSSLTGYTRCVRVADDAQKEQFIKDIATEALNTPPATENWEYDRTTKKMTNTINGETKDRFTDNGDGTITDNMIDVKLIKDITALHGGDMMASPIGYTEAVAKLADIGDGEYILPTLEMNAHSRDWIESGYFILPEFISYVKDMWTSKRVDDDVDSDEIKYYQLHTDRVQTSKQFLPTGGDSMMENGSILFPIRMDKLVADAGIDKKVKSGETITLDGSRSYEGITSNTISYQWSFITSNREYNSKFGWIKTVRELDIASPTSKSASFVVPEVDYPQNLRFKLTMSDENGKISEDYVDYKVYKDNFVKLKEDGTEINSDYVEYDDDNVQLEEDEIEYRCVKETDVTPNRVWIAIKDSEINNTYTYSEALAYIDTLNTNSVCGVTTWRLPTKEEFDESKKKYNIKANTNVMHELDAHYFGDDGQHYLYWITNSAKDSLIDDPNYTWAGRYTSFYDWTFRKSELEATHKNTAIRVWAVSGN
jgi:hypothetical protein